MPFLPMLLLVFRLRDVLVALNELGARARSTEIELPGVFRADRRERQQARQVLTLTGGARWNVARAYQLLELASASLALVLVKGHAL